jgi:hypothetical protein
MCTSCVYLKDLWPVFNNFIYFLYFATFVEGESTLHRGQKCCHIVMFSRGVHVWTSITVILDHVFPIFLHNMVNYNTKKSVTKIFFFQLILCDSEAYLWQQNVCHYVLKIANILKKWLKWFLIFMKIIISIKHCDPIWLE